MKCIRWTFWNVRAVLAVMYTFPAHHNQLMWVWGRGVQSHFLPFQWFIPIPDPRFNLVLFSFPFHSHRLFPFPPAPIPVLLVVSRSDNKWQLTQQSMEQYCYKKKINQSFKSTHAVSMHAVSRAHSEWNLTVYDKLLCQNKGLLRVSDDQLSMGWRWGNVEVSFPPIPVKPFPFPWN